MRPASGQVLHRERVEGQRQRLEQRAETHAHPYQYHYTAQVRDGQSKEGDVDRVGELLLTEHNNVDHIRQTAKGTDDSSQDGEVESLEKSPQGIVDEPFVIVSLGVRDGVLKVSQDVPATQLGGGGR